jgi:hypothetical protein
MNPGARKSASSTALSVNDLVGVETDKLTKISGEGGLGQHKREALKALVRCQIIYNKALMGLRSRRSNAMAKSVR